MEKQSRSINKMIEEQLKKWQYTKNDKTRKMIAPTTVVTISRSAGSDGRLFAKDLRPIGDLISFTRRWFTTWQSVARNLSFSEIEVAKRITLTESRRYTFIRRHYSASVSELYQYDMALNTDMITIDKAVAAIKAVVLKRTTSDIT